MKPYENPYKFLRLSRTNTKHSRTVCFLFRSYITQQLMKAFFLIILSLINRRDIKYLRTIYRQL